MMIKLSSASITHATVLAIVQHVRIANVTVQIVLHVVIENELLGIAICALFECLIVKVLNDSYFIRWVHFRGHISLDDQQ